MQLVTVSLIFFTLFTALKHDNILLLWLLLIVICINDLNLQVTTADQTGNSGVKYNVSL